MGIQILQALKDKCPNYKKLIGVVLNWTGRDIFFTQKLIELILEAEDGPPRDREAEWIESLVQVNLIQKWERLPELRHLRVIRDRVCQNNDRSIKLLKLYQQILQYDGVPANKSPEHQELELSGLVVNRSGFLKVYNRIYQSIFNQDWVKRSIDKIQVKLQPNDAELIARLNEIERKLLLYQISLLSETEQEEKEQKSEQFLYEVLRNVTSQIGELLGADRTTIYLLNSEKTELWSLFAQNQEGEFLDIQVRVGEGIAGLVAQTKKVINISNNVYEDPRSELVKEYDKKYHYRTENILAFPILNEDKEVVAVIQLLNKLQKIEGLEANSPLNIDTNGFTLLDLERLAKCVLPLRQILETCQSSYTANKKLQATGALTEALRSLDQINLNTEAVLQRVMDAAKKLMNADRSTLWLVDREHNDLWTELPGEGVLRCEFGVGFAGKVAQTCEPMIIPFDLYQHPDAENAKKTDDITRYRTCSLLCMPILSPDGELLGVTQLVNKRKPGNFPEYNKNEWPKVPDFFKASFDNNDRQAMQVFNDRVGVILKYLKSQEKTKKQALVESTDAIHTTLSLLSHAASDKGDEALYAMLSFLQTSVKKIVNAENITIFLLNSEQNKLWSLFQENEGQPPIEIRIPANQGVAGMVVNSRTVKASRKLTDFKDIIIKQAIPKSLQNKLQNLLLFPLLNTEGELLGIIRLINKLHPIASINSESEGTDIYGFTKLDVENLQQQTHSFLPMLQAFQSFYREIRALEQQRKAIDPLYQAITLVNQSHSKEDVIQRVMQAAKNITNADRSTFWLVDYRSKELWTKLPQADGSWMEVRVPIGEGFVGRVAKTGLFVNIPFDVYDHPSSELAKKTDRKTGYRTCSLLCVPVISPDGELVAVTQLLNKRKPGYSSDEYDPAIWSRVPDFFKASFDEKDLKNMEVFNKQIGTLLDEMF